MQQRKSDAYPLKENWSVSNRERKQQSTVKATKENDFASALPAVTLSKQGCFCKTTE